MDDFELIIPKQLFFIWGNSRIEEMIVIIDLN